MIYKAIIDQVLNDGYQAKIRIPKLHKIENVAGATLSRDLPIATICTQPGVLPVYKTGDIVFVSFENDDTNYPLILGQLYCNSNKSQSNNQILSLKVDSCVKLPITTTIGDIDYNDIIQLKELKGSIQYQLNLLKELNESIQHQIDDINKKLETSE